MKKRKSEKKNNTREKSGIRFDSGMHGAKNAESENAGFSSDGGSCQNAKITSDGGSCKNTEITSDGNSCQNARITSDGGSCKNTEITSDGGSCKNAKITSDGDDFKNMPEKSRISPESETEKANPENIEISFFYDDGKRSCVYPANGAGTEKQEKNEKQINQSGNSASGKKQSSRHKPGRKHIFLKFSAFVFILISAAAILFFAHFFRPREWHRFDSSLILDADASTLVYDSGGKLVSVIAGGENRIPVKADSLPVYVKNAFVSAEDARFYKHKGFDIVRIFGAALADLKAAEFTQGASTIGQQLIKLSHLTSEKTFERKLEEVWLSTRMEAEFSKDEILEMYLNYVYFGNGFYGIETAALGYFGVHAEDLSIAQAAQLAGILKSPKNYAPHLNMKKSVSRRNNVLSLMLEYGHISAAEYRKAVNESCNLKNGIPSERNYYIDYALKEASLMMNMSMNDFLKSGFSVYTGLDTGLNEKCTEIMNSRALFPCRNAQGALVVLRNDGSIAALCGGRGEYSPFCFNRAVDSRRQPGSLIKPLLCYAPAIDLFGYSAASILSDTPRDFDGYKPRNPNGIYKGSVSLRYALIESLNVPAVSLLSDIGIPSAVLFAENLGISFENERLGLPLALGGFSYGISPLEAAGAYNAFSAGGNFIRPHALLSIQKGSRELYSFREAPVSAMSCETAFIMTNILENAVSDGTAKLLSKLHIPVAAKTGTNLDGSGNVRDVWAAAYTSEYTAVCRLGTDRADEGSLPDGTTGGNSACKFLKEIFGFIYKKSIPPCFEKPESVLICELDAKASAECGFPVLATRYTPKEDTYSEYFTESTVPLAVSCYWQLPAPPAEVSWYIDSGGKPVISFESADRRLHYLIIRQTQDGNERTVAELTGSEGRIEFRDVSALPGSLYVYSIAAVHPEITVNGQNARSSLSRQMRVYIPLTENAG